MKKRDPRKILIGRVHQAAKALGLDDEEYRAVLERRTGKSSCRDLNTAELASVMNEMERLGWRRPGRAQGAQPTFYMEIPDSDPNARQKRKILGMWGMLGYSEDYLHERCRRQFGVEDFRWLKKQNDLQVLTKDLVNRCRKRGLNPYPER